jgi:predicted XRE-type DNA-binding protein
MGAEDAPRKERKKRITKRQREIIRTRIKHPYDSQSQLANRLGVHQPYVSKELAKPHVKSYLAELMDKEPALQDEALNKKLAEKLAAKKTIFFADKGTVTDSRDVEDNSTQMDALHLAYELKGHKVKKVDHTSGGQTMKDLFFED